jgi:hypothetical protein
MHLDNANGEKQAIWTRHATMLVGNSIIVQALVRPERFDHYTALFLNIAGLALCILWGAMTWGGWDWFYKSLRAGAIIQVDPIFNPFADLSNPTRRRDHVFIVTMLVVCLFTLLYLINVIGLIWARPMP